MAINSAAKRASALSYNSVSELLIIPDNKIDEDDRETIGDCYSGIIWTKQVDAVTTWTPQIDA